MNARYNFACSMMTYLQQLDPAIDLLGPVFNTMSIAWLNHAKADPDLDPCVMIPASTRWSLPPRRASRRRMTLAPHR
jgi:hypothetical protein